MLVSQGNPLPRGALGPFRAARGVLVKDKHTAPFRSIPPSGSRRASPPSQTLREPTLSRALDECPVGDRPHRHSRLRRILSTEHLVGDEGNEAQGGTSLCPGHTAGVGRRLDGTPTQPGQYPLPELCYLPTRLPMRCGVMTPHQSAPTTGWTGRDPACGQGPFLHRLCGREECDFVPISGLCSGKPCPMREGPPGWRIRHCSPTFP